MNEDFHSRVEKEFADYLINIGYPKDSIVYEPVFKTNDGNRSFRPDFLIIDPVKKEKLALIEIKEKHKVHNDVTQKQLRAYSKAVGNDKIPVFLVSPSNNTLLPFDLHIFNIDSGLIPTDFSLFPTFSALSAEETIERKSELRSEKNRISESFKYVSWISAFIIFTIIVADFICAQYDIKLLTTERMALLGAVVALVVMPFAQKFKGLGIEWEKATQVDKGS